ncbi:MAG: hypothetical protein NTX50_11025 [Candidatus Sumerlaeota bacterium]|nr:hypothetical protein [Candidatus Sumerlaeota bacterium]
MRKLFTNEKFSFSARKRLANPRKTYLLDTGFGLLSTSFSENKGKWLENAVAIEMRRLDRAMFYFKDRHECDFIIMDGARPAEAWQVCWELTPQNEPRELNGLAAAMDQLKIKTGGILTFDQEGKRDCGKRKIPVMPVWKWLLGAESAK